ncbi:hypothetical protein B0H10DRAFT_2163200 [Mycena sp. CBHHK59/15]|nr:hypothetical protein B0H10DRAFT_2163200 [Mycena sp. CBHHK59/15]
MNSPIHPPPRILIILEVGAGPSGLVLALALCRNGVPVRLIDKEIKPRLGQRGAGIMPRSQELFNALGVGDEVSRCAIPPPPAVMYEMPGGVNVIHKFDMWPTSEPTPQRPFPNIVMLGQDHLEQILRAELKRFSCEIEWGSTLLSFEQRDGEDFVRTDISRAGPDEVVTTKMATFDYVIGTDGARGMVRKTLGLTFLGETSNADNLVIGDVMVDGLDPNFWHMWGEVGSAWISLRPTERKGIDHGYLVAHPDALALMFVESTGGRKDLSFKDVIWLSHYRYRMVDRFGTKRVFVAGDSAHVHSITGGQGMNTGIQDSFNLAWKLALVQRKLAPESLLHTYTEERAPVVAEMLNKITALLSETLSSKAADDSWKHNSTAWKHNGGVLQLGVNCRWSSLVVDEQRDGGSLEDIDEEYYGDEDVDEDYPDSYLDRPLLAGDRAPDAPGLVDIKRRLLNETGSEATTSLFKTFLPSAHTVLIFTNEANRYTPVIRLLESYPKDIIRSVIIIRSQGTIPRGAGVLADSVLEDRAGHAYATYIFKNECDVVIVRPDGLVGAIVRSREGLKRYLIGVFKGHASNET